MSAHVESVAVLAPGLSGWQAARAVLAGETPYTAAPLAPVLPQALPPNERRRAPLGVRMALQVAAEALADPNAGTLASLFVTSDADLDILHRICSALAEPERAVSPTDFHNSVHNAASGYWSIAAAAHGPSTTIAAHDHGLAAGLREAFGIVAIDAPRVLLVLYDVPPPAPLFDKRPIQQPVAVALVLTRDRTPQSLARLSLCDATHESELVDAELEALRRGNPAARALPLLQLIARARSETVGLRLADDRVLGVRLDCT